jgi:hypothetical protein
MYPCHLQQDNIRTKVSHKRGRQTHEEGQREAKHIRESEYWHHPTTTTNHYTVLLEEDSGQQQQKGGPGKTPKPPPIYVSDMTTISPLIQLLGQIVEQQYLKH